MTEPRLSVVLAAKGGFPSIRHTVRHLAAQSIAPEIELLIIALGGGFPFPDPHPFQQVRVLPAPRDASVATANAIGVRAAHSPVVAFAEDHCFPGPHWAEALLDAHRAPHAAVGPVMRNANPGSIVSWCDFLIGYGPWFDPSPAGVRPFLPGHNSSYKRAELLHYGERLEQMLESETVLHYDLTARRKSLYLEPRAHSAHLNFALFSVWIPVQYHCGRVFAGFRAASWTPGRKLFYAAASPLIPLVRFLRVIRELLQPGRPAALLFRVAHVLLLGLIADGIGQFAGYLAGPGRSPGRLAGYEYNRVRYITRADRERLDA